VFGALKVAKKKDSSKDKQEEIDELGEDLLDDEEVESVYPKVEKTKEKQIQNEEEESSIFDDEAAPLGEEEFEFEEPEGPERPTYKYLNLELKKGEGVNDYKLLVEGQSHGFCNVLVKHLLNIDGVKVAAYQVTRIDPPVIFIRIEEGKKIKNLIHKGIEALRNEVSDVESLFSKV